MFASTSYIFYQYIVETLVIVVVMVIGDVFFPQTFHEFIGILSFPVIDTLYKILISWCNEFILTGLGINQLQIIIFATSTLLKVWLLL